MKQDVLILLNDNFKVLNVIYDNSIMIGEEFYCPLSQGEMAKIVDMARMTFSRNLQELINIGFVEPRSTTLRKYILTSRGEQVIKTIRKI